jgi:hypothetical protein
MRNAIRLCSTKGRPVVEIKFADISSPEIPSYIAIKQAASGSASNWGHKNAVADRL